jgi:hypothetical protein
MFVGVNEDVFVGDGVGVKVDVAEGVGDDVEVGTVPTLPGAGMDCDCQSDLLSVSMSAGKRSIE